ncbi:hypothetical protein PUN28_007721 [Cardiocondyla obscurior]|uniref:Uncharacterized protein n=1 Tax=Cardiocondyla obscurior TaxID=286306 RepID=A0AAW2FZR6_9HYME
MHDETPVDADAVRQLIATRSHGRAGNLGNAEASEHGVPGNQRRRGGTKYYARTSNANGGEPVARVVRTLNRKVRRRDLSSRSDSKVRPSKNF